MISLYGNLLKDVKESTKGNVERRQATAEERLAAEAESEDEQDELQGNNKDSDATDANELEDGHI